MVMQHYRGENTNNGLCELTKYKFLELAGGLT